MTWIYLQAVPKLYVAVFAFIPKWVKFRQTLWPTAFWTACLNFSQCTFKQHSKHKIDILIGSLWYCRLGRAKFSTAFKINSIQCHHGSEYLLSLLTKQRQSFSTIYFVITLTYTLVFKTSFGCSVAITCMVNWEMMWKLFSILRSLYLLSLSPLETTNTIGTLLDRKER